MSYCRWSSDDFKSDLYVYASVHGCWTIHVAANRIVGEVPPCSLSLLKTDGPEAYMAARKVRTAFMDTAEHVPIGLPHDGETFNLASPGECADKCAELATMGYHVPDGVVAALREEGAEVEGELA